MNNTINRIKKRADILTDYIVDRVERLEKENATLRNDISLKSSKLHDYETIIRRLAKESEVAILENKDIVISEKNHNFYRFSKDSPFYPLAEKIYSEKQDQFVLDEVLKYGVTSKAIKKGE